MVYIVICCCCNGHEYYEIDSVWTSERKAEKRCDELNEKGEKYLIEKCGCGLYLRYIYTVSKERYLYIKSVIPVTCTTGNWLRWIMDPYLRPCGTLS